MGRDGWILQVIVIRVELWSAITGKQTELARMAIYNESGDGNSRDYSGKTYRGRDKKTLIQSMINDTVTKRGEVLRHPAEKQHIWNLVSKMLNNMGYGT